MRTYRDFGALQPPNQPPPKTVPLRGATSNVQAAKRKAKGYRTKRNLKAIVYLIAGDALANSPI
jgi:hypothetical protein